MKPILSLLGLLLFLQSCKTEDEEEFQNIIDEELRPFIEDFIVEAEKRGVVLDIRDIRAELVDEFTISESDGFCAYALWDYTNEETGRIEVLNTAGCWGNRSEIEKENLMFHELGHAYLDRPHLSTTFPNDYPSSIMCSFTDGVECNNYDVYYDFEPLKDYYLDELFDRTTHTPDFVANTSYVRTVYEENDTNEYLTDWELYAYVDGELVDGQGFYTLTKESSSNLTLTQNERLFDTEVFLIRRFEIDNYTPCSTLKAISDISINNLQNGSVETSLSLRERMDDGSLNRFFIYGIEETTNGEFDNYTHEIYCIGDNTDVVTISFNLEALQPCEIKVDNLRIDLYE